MKRILSGVQPTNKLTLGNYLGAIRNWVDLQHKAESIFCIVDLHAITIYQDPKELHDATLGVAAAYLAAGIDPVKSLIFVQSQVPYHTELSWMLSCMTPMGWLNRMTQFKDKAGKDKEKACLGLYAYPVLMAADILAYKATHVPVGEDQKQHLEMARDLAGTFNHLYGEDFFPLPEPLIQGPAPRVMSLRDGTSKMSKSDPSDFSRIHLMDSDDEIAQKIRKAKTDPEPLPDSIKGLEDRPEAKNLVTIYSALKGISLEQAVVETQGQQFSTFKPLLTDVLIDHLKPIRSEMERYLKDPAYLMTILNQGREKASAICGPVTQDVKKKIGFLGISPR